MFAKLFPHEWYGVSGGGVDNRFIGELNHTGPGGAGCCLQLQDSDVVWSTGTEKIGRHKKGDLGPAGWPVSTQI